MRYIAYAINKRTGDLMRVAVNQSDGEKAIRDAKAHSRQHGESWLYAADKGQILIGHFINGQSERLTPPKMNAGTGKAFTFHGSYTSKLLAQKKERQTPGSFIEARDGRYYVLKPKKIRSNPRTSGVKIYGRCLRIEAIKTGNHTYGGKPTPAGQHYYHDFTSKNAKIYGLPNGDLLISVR